MTRRISRTTKYTSERNGQFNKKLPICSDDSRFQIQTRFREKLNSMDITIFVAMSTSQEVLLVEVAEEAEKAERTPRK